MKNKHTFFRLLLLGILLVHQGCIEELDIDSAINDEGFGHLVVETTLTDMLERQTVYLSRTDTRFDLETDTVYSYVYPLGIGSRDSVLVEQRANVKVVNSEGLEYQFKEDEPGTYISLEPFNLELGKEYYLEIITDDGKSYRSEELMISEKSELDAVNIDVGINDQGQEVVLLTIDSEPTIGDPLLYRYTYEETFKIIAPNWNPKEFLLTDYDPCALPVPTYNLDTVNRTIQNRVCYQTVPSNTIIQYQDNDTRAGVNNFLVRSINRNNFIISHRYSILVRQYVQSLNAYLFYENIKSLSESESVFSQIQTGPLLSNVENIDNEDEMVLGYVDAASVSEKRIYFNFEDIFPGEELPDFPYNCNIDSAPETHQSYCAISLGSDSCPQSIIERVNLGLITYVGENDEDSPIGTCPGPYTFVPRVCGDCLILGENTPPDFWIEE